MPIRQLNLLVENTENLAIKTADAPGEGGPASPTRCKLLPHVPIELTWEAALLTAKKLPAGGFYLVIIYNTSVAI